MAKFAVRLEGSIYSRQSDPADVIRKRLWENRREQRRSDQISLSAAMEQRARYSDTWVYASRPITAADLGAWIPKGLLPAIVCDLDKLQQIPIRFLGKDLSVRLGICLENASCAFLGDVLTLDNPLKIKNFGRKTLDKLEDVLNNLVIRAAGLPAPTPFSASTLFLQFKDFNFRRTDGVLAHPDAAVVIRDRLGAPHAQVEILSPFVPVNLLPRLPEDLKAKLSGHLETLKDVPIAWPIKRKSRTSILDIPLSVRLANFLNNSGFATLGDCLVDSKQMRYMGRPQTYLEFVNVLRQVIDRTEK